MGKKLDALLGRSFKTHKFKRIVNLAFSRIDLLKTQRLVHLRQARSDVLQLLRLSQHQRALVRVERVIKEQNMLDVYDEIEGYCYLLLERVHLITQERECPQELKEAVSGVIYVSSRCGDFPEIHKIRTILTSRFGREFAMRAIELRNGCKVRPKLVTKLSTRMSSSENRIKVLKDIAKENNIVLPIDEEEEVTNKEGHIQQHKSEKEEEILHINLSNVGKNVDFFDSFKVNKKYKEVADAAQAAVMSAAYAAAAARAAVELLQSQSHDLDDDDDNDSSCTTVTRKASNVNGSLKVMYLLEGKDIFTEKEKQVKKNAEEELERPKNIGSSNASLEIVEYVDKGIEVVDPIGIEDGTKVLSLSEMFGYDEMNSAPLWDSEKKSFSLRPRLKNGARPQRL